MGGIARTVCYRGNRIDIGGHRFFSKSDRVMEWWLRFLPLQALPQRRRRRAPDSHRLPEPVAQRSTADGDGPDPEREDRVMLLRPRRSRIYHRRKLFDYPIRLSPDTLRKLGLWRSVRIGFSYLRAAAFPIRPEENLEQFFVNRFGRELYRTFFKDYTEKVWGTPCERDQRRLGRAARQGTVDRQGAGALRALDRSWLDRPAPRRRRRTEGDGDLAHRAVPLPQARPRPDVGRGGARGAREGRPGAHRLARRGAGDERRPRRRRARPPPRERRRRAPGGRLGVLDDAHSRAGARARRAGARRGAPRSPTGSSTATSSPSACCSTGCSSPSPTAA